MAATLTVLVQPSENIIRYCGANHYQMGISSNYVITKMALIYITSQNLVNSFSVAML